ncbi:AraC-like DNA-binding protein [Chitinophaga skermanii]|uniref:AraC-like DNA-binding protein n=1 Tax=Chitinophaga skermanii TaxID=331697 RepID=A0A327QII4_9BACT|nr:AraC family transcriptional regulator [Chitinophaga skermanii]RAJ04131.1 AraC-like DNA-binding protein [Chitinophaga skermanii]
MFTTYENFTAGGQQSIHTWFHAGNPWAALNAFHGKANHSLYIPQTIINLITSGQKNMYDGSHMAHLCPGDIYLIPQGSLICSEILPQTYFESFSCTVPLPLLWLYVDEKVEAVVKHSTKLQVPQQWMEWLALPHISPITAYHGILQTIQQAPSGNAILQMLYKATVSEHRSVEEVLQYQLAQIQSLDEIAAACYMSTASLKRKMQAIYGKSPMKYVWEKRAALACFLMRTSELSIRDVAFTSGFQDVSHFHRTFKKYFGRTPMQLKNELYSQSFTTGVL